MVTLASITHTYAVTTTGPAPVTITEPSVHGPLTWGPWWNVETWTSR